MYEDYGCFLVCLLLVLDWLLTEFLTWVGCGALAIIGVTVPFSWGLGFGVWVLVKIIKLLLK